MMNRMFQTAALALALGGFAQVGSGATVSVNFVGGQNGPNGAGTVTAPAGFNLAPNWNNAIGAAGSLPSAINDSGVAAASITWNSPNTWAATGAAPAGGGSATMMSGYLDNFGGRNINVSGLGADFTSKGYDVIVYFNADSAGTQGYSVTAPGYASTLFGNQAGGAGTNFPLAGGTNGFKLSTQTASNTNFAANGVRFTGLTGSSFTLSGVNGTLGDGRARPNGFQIISGLPKPTGQIIVAESGDSVVSGYAHVADSDGNPTGLPVSWKLEQFSTTPGLKTEWFANAGVDTRAAVNTFLAGNPVPTIPAFITQQVAFGGPAGFPAEVTAANLQGSGNRVVRYTGQIFIPESGVYRFKDGVDQSTQVVIGGKTVISDDFWTNFNGAGGDNGGSAINTASFTVAEGGEWLDFSFIMGEVCCGNQASLYWDYDPINGLGANPAFPANATTAAGLGALVPTGSFRALNLIASISGVGEVDGVFTDGVTGQTLTFNPANQALRLTVTGEGLTFTTSALNSIPEPGTIGLLGLSALALLRRRRVA